jgi:hypothetical protein
MESRAMAGAQLAQSLLRPVVTFAFALAVIAGFMGGKVSVEAFMSVASGVIGYWYGVSRNDRRATDGEVGDPREVKVIEGTKTTTEVLKTERVEAPPPKETP